MISFKSKVTACREVALPRETTLQAHEIGFFDSYLDEAIRVRRADIVQVGRAVYYCDVSVSVGQAGAVANSESSRYIRIGLHLCLRSVTQD